MGTGKVEGPRLDQQLCFALYAASNAVVRAYRPMLARIGLTYPQYLVMMVLWEADGRSVQELAGRVDQPAHGLTPVLRRLVEAGLITRSADRDDRRVVRIFLSAAGRRLAKDAAAVQLEVACRTGLGATDYAQLRDRLQMLADETSASPGRTDAPAGAPSTESLEESAADSFEVTLLRSDVVAAYSIDDDGALAAVSPAAALLLHWAAEDLVGRPAHDTLHHSDAHGVPAPAASCPIQAGRANGRIARGERDTFWRRDGAPMSVWWTAIPTVDQKTGVRRTTVVFDRVDGAVAPHTGHSDTDTRLLVLGQLSELLGINDVDEGLHRVAALGASTLADWCVIDRVGDEGLEGLTRAALADRLSDQSVLDSRLTVMPPVTTHSTGSLGRVLRELDSVAVELFVDDRPFAGVSDDPLDAAQAELFADLGAAHAFVVPLRSRSTVLGAMTWVRTDPAQPFTDTDILLATVFGFRVGLWLDNARLYDLQKRMSETLQRSLLTPLPEPDHLHVVARYLPALREAEVGGDWYDAMLTHEGDLALTIGDVTGHDINAAARMSQVRSMTRFALLDHPSRPDKALSRVDAAMPALAIDGQASAIVFVVTQDDEQRARSQRRLTWSNAGHLPPLLIGPDGAVQMLDTSPDLILGVRAGAPRTTHHVDIAAGSTLMLYTDGLIERRDETLDVGLRRMCDTAEASAALPLEEFCDRMLQTLAPDDRRSDDIAIIAVRFHPEDHDRPDEAGPEILAEDLRADSSLTAGGRQVLPSR